MSDFMPARRTAALVVRESGDETLVFDTRTDEVHCLPASLSSVWLALDAASSVAELAALTGTTEGAVSAALVSLDDIRLLETGKGFDRRRFLTRAGLVGAGAIGAVTILAPAAMAANSGATVTLTGTPATLGGRAYNFTAALANFTTGVNYTATLQDSSTKVQVGSTTGVTNTSATFSGITTVVGHTYTATVVPANNNMAVTSAAYPVAV